MRSTPSSAMAGLIRKAFRKSRMSIKALSDRSGVHYAAVHAFVNGTRDPMLWTVERLCKVLGLELRPVRRGERKTKGSAKRGENLSATVHNKNRRRTQGDEAKQAVVRRIP